jgi:hypothetical protein
MLNAQESIWFNSEFNIRDSELNLPGLIDNVLKTIRFRQISSSLPGDVRAVPIGIKGIKHQQ